MRGKSRSPMPTPVSSTSKLTASFAALQRTVIVPPLRVYLIALSTRLSSTWRMASGSANAVAGPFSDGTSTSVWLFTSART